MLKKLNIENFKTRVKSGCLESTRATKALPLSIKKPVIRDKVKLIACFFEVCSDPLQIQGEIRCR